MRRYGIFSVMRGEQMINHYIEKKDTSSCTELYFSTFNIRNFTKVAKSNSFKNEQKVNQIKQTAVVSNQRYPCLHIVSHVQRNV